MSYAEWKADVDRRLLQVVGMESGDLPDWEWKEEYEEDVEACEAVSIFVEEMQDEFLGY